MNLIILNKSFGNFKNTKESIFYNLKDNQGLEEIKKIIIKNTPNNIISIDFGIQTNKYISNNTIIIGKESILINSKPVDWSIPRADRWSETSERLNHKISNLLEENCLAHEIASCAQLEYTENIKKREKAIAWIYKNIKVSFIDDNSAELLKIIFEMKLSDKFTFIRLINNNYQLSNNKKDNLLKKIINYLYAKIFTKYHMKKTFSEIYDKKIITKLSVID